MTDAARVVALYETAARAGRAAAQVNLARLLAHQDTDDAALELAYAWTVLAAEAGSSVATDNLRRLDGLLAEPARERARVRARELLDGVVGEEGPSG
jgi:TPR repeat protein